VDRAGGRVHVPVIVPELEPVIGPGLDPVPGHEKDPIRKPGQGPMHGGDIEL
jgi:hypothetical protein